MDFEPQYTPEQEEFRQEVKAWMKDNIPSGIVHPADPIDLTEEQYQKRREFGRRLGEKGWLWSTAETKYGGGGLDVDHAIVLEEEAESARTFQKFFVSQLNVRSPRTYFNPHRELQRVEANIFRNQQSPWARAASSRTDSGPPKI